MHFILTGATFINTNIGQLDLDSGEMIATIQTVNEDEEEEE